MLEWGCVTKAGRPKSYKSASCSSIVVGLCANIAPVTPLSGRAVLDPAPYGTCAARAQVAVLRVLGQLGQVYSCMRVRALADLVPFMTLAEVERLIVAAVKHGHLQVCLRARATSHLTTARRAAQSCSCVLGVSAIRTVLVLPVCGEPT